MSKHSHSDAVAQVVRLLTILQRLRSRQASQRISKDDLAALCCCSGKTIQRDIGLLAAISYDYSARTYVFSEDGWTYPTLKLSAEDALALALARSLISGSRFPEPDLLDAALTKVTDALPAPLRDLLESASAALHAPPGPRDYSSAPLQTILRARMECRTLEMDYDSRRSGKREWRWLDPYGVEPSDEGMWFVHGWCHGNQEIRSFALDRIKQARLANEPFTVREPDWSAFRAQRGVMSGLRGGSVVTVEARFAPLVAPYALDKTWDESLSLHCEPDGSVLMTGWVMGTDGIMNKLLAWKRHVAVLGGPELRAAMADETRAMAALYEDTEK